MNKKSINSKKLKYNVYLSFKYRVRKYFYLFYKNYYPYAYMCVFVCTDIPEIFYIIH